MIVPMKRVHIICQNKDAAQTVRQLRSLGVVHVEHSRIPQGTDIAALQADIALITAAIDILMRYNVPDATALDGQQCTGDWKTIARHVVDLDKRIDQLTEYSRVLKAKINEWEQWGDFEPSQIESLVRRNIFVRFFQIPAKKLDGLASNMIVYAISCARVLQIALLYRARKNL